MTGSAPPGGSAKRVQRLKRFSAGALLCGLLAAPALAQGDANAGARTFNQCKACHTLEAGKNRVGPNLHGIVGAPSGAVEGFRYSRALSEANLTWDAETLTAFLANPREMVPGNRMAFRGLSDPQDIADLIAYIEAESQD